MTLSKILLALLVTLALLVQNARARYMAALLCEGGRMRNEKRNNSPLYVCYSSSSSCSYQYSGGDWYFTQWNGFRFADLYQVACSGSTHAAGLCYYSGGQYYFTDQCPGGNEANILIVADYNRRRLRGKEEDGEAIDEPEELEVEIDGEKVTVLKPPHDE